MTTKHEFPADLENYIAGLRIENINLKLAAKQADALIREAYGHVPSGLLADRIYAFLASQQGESCKTCGGTGMVDDGEIWCSEGGIPYENGSVKCVKDCPSCTGKHPEQAEGAPLYSEGICQDGAAILRDGVPVPVAEVIEMLNRAALAQPSPKCATCNDAEVVSTTDVDHNGDHVEIRCPDCAQPSPAPELERPEVVGYRSATSRMVYEQDYGLQRPEPMMLVAQHDRIVGAHAGATRLLADSIASLRAERDAAQARVAELEKQEPVAWVDADWIAQVSDPRGVGCTVRRAYGSAGVGLAPLYASPVAQAGQVPQVLREAIKWADHLLFECGALVQTRAPSVHVYNQTYAAVEAAKALLAAAPAQGGSDNDSRHD